MQEPSKIERQKHHGLGQTKTCAKNLVKFKENMKWTNVCKKQVTTSCWKYTMKVWNCSYRLFLNITCKYQRRWISNTVSKNIFHPDSKNKTWTCRNAVMDTQNLDLELDDLELVAGNSRFFYDSERFSYFKVFVFQCCYSKILMGFLLCKWFFQDFDRLSDFNVFFAWKLIRTFQYLVNSKFKAATKILPKAGKINLLKTKKQKNQTGKSSRQNQDLAKSRNIKFEYFFKLEFQRAKFVLCINSLKLVKKDVEYFWIPPKIILFVRNLEKMFLPNKKTTC